MRTLQLRERPVRTIRAVKGQRSDQEHRRTAQGGYADVRKVSPVRELR